MNQMIIWIASYPKSGNTWVRSLLSSYLYTDKGDFNFELLRKIDQFPEKKYFDFFIKDYSDIKKVSNYWIAAQDRINLLNKKITFFKTHSALCTLENNAFTNKNNSKAVIYIVRDPRNIITSLSHHYSKTQEESFDFMTNSNKILTKDEQGTKNFGISSVLGSWSDHYKSWRDIGFAPFLLVKYEDLINDTELSLLKILNFLKSHMEINIDQNKIINSVNSCSFDNLVSKEKSEGFIESVNSKKDNKKLKFFFLGKKNIWNKLVSKDLQKKINSIFVKEMKELKYL
jgi:hypothetical protein